ncbi:MAG: hypothetical protein MI920_01995 [Kiloniellales bacterium]|nr:hypothetical protein [Kiloniellales bacterium]
MRKQITRLGDAPGKAEWLDLAQGVRVLVEPFTTMRHQVARAKAQGDLRALRKAIEDGQVAREAAPDLGDIDAMMGAMNSLTIKHLAVIAVRDWEGVYPKKRADGEDGEAADDDRKPLPCTPDNVAHLMEQEPLVADSFEARYGIREVELLDEGEGFAAGPIGGSAAAPGSAEAAKTSTAAPAPSARSRSTRRRRLKAGSPGTS